MNALGTYLLCSICFLSYLISVLALFLSDIVCSEYKHYVIVTITKIVVGIFFHSYQIKKQKCYSKANEWKHKRRLYVSKTLSIEK